MEAAAIITTGPSACPSSPHTRSAAKTLGVVTTVGIAVALLTWRATDAGLGWLVADSVLVVALLAGVGRGRPRAAQCLLAVTSLWLAGATAWYASDWALLTAFPASVVALAMLAVATARRIGAGALSEL